MNKPSKLDLRGGVSPQTAQDSAPESAVTPAAPENPAPTPVAPTPAPTPSQPDLTAILSAMQKMQATIDSQAQELQRVKDFSTSLTVFENQQKSQERYKGPWKYSYKMYEGKPICSIKMTKNEVLLNPATGRYVANQVVEMTFPDGEKKEIDYGIFYQVYTSSEKMFAKEVITRDGKQFFKFEINGESFTVDESAIN